MTCDSIIFPFEIQDLHFGPVITWPDGLLFLSSPNSTKEPRPSLLSGMIVLRSENLSMLPFKFQLHYLASGPPKKKYSLSIITNFCEKVKTKMVEFSATSTSPLIMMMPGETHTLTPYSASKSLTQSSNGAVPTHVLIAVTSPNIPHPFQTTDAPIFFPFTPHFPIFPTHFILSLSLSLSSVFFSLIVESLSLQEHFSYC
jgi:hypothetical protein